jgi:hypothetical protein
MHSFPRFPGGARVLMALTTGTEQCCFEICQFRRQGLVSVDHSDLMWGLRTEPLLLNFRQSKFDHPVGRPYSGEPQNLKAH